MTIDRYFDRHRYLGAKPGEEVFVTVSVKNNSDAPYENLTVTENLPNGAVTKDGKAPSWTVTVLPGCEVKLSYPVTITAKDGETATFPGGFVDQIPTRDMSLAVKQPVAPSVTATQFANNFCQAVFNTNPGFPEKPGDVISELFELVDVPDTEKTNGKLLTPKKFETLTPEMQALWKKLLPEHVGGRAVYLGHDMKTMGCFGRIKQFEEAAYLPGDVFFCLESPSILELGNIRRARVYIYMGDGQVITWDADMNKPVVTTFAATLGVAMKMNVILGFRP